MILPEILKSYPRAIEWMLTSNCCTPELKGKMISRLQAQGLEKLTYAIKHIGPIIKHTCLWTNGLPNPGLEVLNSANLDSCGGLTWHLRQKRDTNVEYSTNFQVSKQVDDQTASELNGFGAYCRQQGAQFVVIPPPVPVKMFLVQKPQVDRLMADYKKRVNVPLLGSPERYAMPHEMMFGQYYHLNKVGRPVRTEMVIEDIRAFLDANPS